MKLDYRVLGPFEVWADGRQLDIGGARQRRLIAALVLADGRPMSAERLIDIVWVAQPPEQARNTLRTYIARARRALEVDGDAPLHTEPTGWRLDRDRDQLDSARFETALAAARAMAADPIAALAATEEALVLWQGEAFAEFRDEDWCTAEAVRLDELRLAAEEERFEAMLGCGLYDDVIGELDRFTELHPLRDRPRAQQMLALYRAGRQVEAVRAFQGYRRYLQAEVGVEASEELRDLEQRIVQRDPSLRQAAPAGRQLRGYQLGQQIGAGAFGRIHRASQATLGREVAIKVVRPELADNPEFIRRFDAEAQIIARLEHPHIVPLFDYWREPGGAYLVMRYLRGGTAQQLVESRGPLTLAQVTRIVEEIGGALATAHAQRVVHRDVKPANILFDEYGASYLADFGIASGVDVPIEPESSSLSDAVYLGPEHATPGAVTPQADIYALGVVLFELLTGNPPFDRDTPLPDLMETKRSRALPSLAGVRPDLPRELDEVIQRATAPDPAARFSTVGDLVLAFARVARGGEDRFPAMLAWSAPNPYRGLAAFGEADAADFHGRDHLVERLVEATERSRFVAVVGPSGSGKSSVVRAGLTPRLRGHGAYVVTMVPGERPMDELTEALLHVTPAARADAVRDALGNSGGLIRALDLCLPDESGELVLIVDQFEELFTASGDDDRDRFLHAVSEAVTNEDARLRVIVTIRADFYDRPLSDAAISQLVQANTVAVTPLDPAELERAISAPAARVGVIVEPALVAVMIADAAGAAMALPLLQYALTTLFDDRDGDTLTAAAYERQGGLGGAVARRADEIFEAHDDDGRSDLRRLFRRLVTPGDRGHDTRRRVRLSELATIPTPLIDAYSDARLLSIDLDPLTREPTVEIAHEALIAEWPRLRRWVDADREALQILRHLTAAAATWETGGRDPGELYRGGRLAAAEEWVAVTPGELNPTEQSFLDASLDQRNVEQDRERRRLRRLRALVTTLAIVAGIAIVAGLLALRERRIADDNAAEADLRAQENRTSQLVTESSLARVAGDPDLAILLALAAHDASAEISTTPRPGVVAALHQAVHASRLERIIDGGHSAIAVSPDGRTVAVDHLDQKDRLATYDIDTGELLADTTLGDNIGGLAYSPDGSLLAVSFCCIDAIRGEELAAMLLLDPATLQPVATLDGGSESWRPSWSADGGRVLAAGWAGVRVWRPDNPAIELTIPDTDVASTAQFIGSSSVAVASSGTLRVIDLDSGETTASREVPDEVAALQVSPAGDRAAFIAPLSQTVHVIDLASEEPPLRIDFTSPQDIRFSPDGSSISIAGNADRVDVVSLATGDVIELRGHGTGAWSHAFGPGGQLLVSMLDGGTRIWNVTPAGPADLGNLIIDGVVRPGVAPSDSSLLVGVQTAPDEVHVEMLDTTTGASRTVAEFWFGDFRWPAFSPDGALVAGYSLDDRLPLVLEAETGRAVATLRACETQRVIDNRNRWVLVQAFECPDPGQSPLANGSRTGFVDLDTGELLVDLKDPFAAFDAAIGPPGTVSADVVAYQGSAGVVFRRASTLEVLASWERPQDVILLSVAFSPDGSKLGVSSQARQGVLFDVEAILGGASPDDAVTLYEEMHTGPTHRVIPVADMIVSTGEGGEIRQWDAAAGALLVDVATDFEQFVQLFALPDGEALYYADADGVLRRYLTDPADLVELARSRVQRGFTEAECDRYFPREGCPT